MSRSKTGRETTKLASLATPHANFVCAECLVGNMESTRGGVRGGKGGVSTLGKVAKFG